MKEVKNMTKKTFGVIGVCGANGNLIARILEERGYDVIGTDLSSAEKCRFSRVLCVGKTGKITHFFVHFHEAHVQKNKQNIKNLNI